MFSVSLKWNCTISDFCRSVYAGLRTSTWNGAKDGPSAEHSDSLESDYGPVVLTFSDCSKKLPALQTEQCALVHNYNFLMSMQSKSAIRTLVLCLILW